MTISRGKCTSLLRIFTRGGDLRHSKVYDYSTAPKFIYTRTVIYLLS